MLKLCLLHEGFDIHEERRKQNYMIYQSRGCDINASVHNHNNKLQRKSNRHSTRLWIKFDKMTDNFRAMVLGCAWMATVFGIVQLSANVPLVFGSSRVLVLFPKYAIGINFICVIFLVGCLSVPLTYNRECNESDPDYICKKALSISQLGRKIKAALADLPPSTLNFFWWDLTSYYSTTGVDIFILIFSVLFLMCAIRFGMQGANQEDSTFLEKLNFSISYGHGANKVFLTSNNDTGTALPVVLNRTGNEIRIECKASFPIDLTFDGHRTNRGFETTIRRNDHHFVIVATTSAHLEATGNYSCFPAGNSERKSSFYVYVAVNIPYILLNCGQTIVVRPTCGEKRILIPCPISNPDYRSSIKLYKQVEDEDTQSQVWNNLDSVPYDPASGFFLRNDPSSPGTYNCSSTLNSLDQLIVIVQPYDAFQVTPDQERWSFKENETFKGKCESSMNIEIKSQNILLKSINNKTISADMITKYELEFETEALNTSNHNHQITCETVDVDNPTPKIWTWLLQLRSDSRGNQGRNSAVLDACQRLNHGIVKFYECHSWIECQMRRCQKFDHQCDSDDEIRNAPDGILQCMSNYTEPKTMIYFKGLSTNNTITEWKKSPKNDILTLKVKVKDIINELFTKNNSKSLQPFAAALKFICEGSRFVFAPDFLWKMTIKPTNGSETFADIPAENITHKFSLLSKSVISSEYTLLSTPKDLWEISCEARIWNSTGSETVKMNYIEVSFAINEVTKKLTSSANSMLIITKSLILFAFTIFICSNFS
ncbi:unnamed protein product [Allacma fusca]|uniref:Uncharacterized protein n=1 Tax=Allacma fusca TaxID=39272 RepID=A0A8J2KV89_9HEXA|nr:unnamed protein product [Allacma fusca]